jgi:ABC-type branched-subunit amino acid transport system ATPase component
MRVIETMDLTKKFGSLTAGDSVNIKVEHGEIFGLLGPTERGKARSFLCFVQS